MSHWTINFWRLVLLSVLLGYLGGQIVHEAGHWFVLEIFRHGPVMSFTGLVQQEETPSNPKGWSQFVSPNGEQVWLHLKTLPKSDAEWVLMLVAGPLAQGITMLLGFALFSFGKQEKVKVVGLLLALINSFGPILYQSLSMLGKGGGDEYFIAQFLEVPEVAVHGLLLGVAVIGLIAGLWKLSGWRLRLKWLGALCIGFVSQGPFLMVANRMTQKQVGLGNPYFRPVLGWSLPVVIVAVVVGLTLALVLMRWEKRVSKT